MSKQRQIKIRVPHLRGGVSRQPASIRKSNQVEEAISVTHSIADGTSKRPGSQYMVPVTGLTASANYRMHGIERDDDEAFVVLYGLAGSNTVLKIWELTEAGSLLASTVTFPTPERTYLESGSPTANDLRLSTFTDSTIVVNTKKAVALGVSKTYKVSSSRPTFQILSSVTFNPNQYGKVRADTETDDNKATFYRYLDTGEPTYGRTQFQVLNATGTPATDWTRATGAWDEGTDRFGFKVGMARIDLDIAGDGAWATATKTLSKSGAFADYVFNTDEEEQIYVTAGTNVTPGWYSIASRISANAIVLDDEITVAGTNQVNITTDAIGREFQVAASFKDVDDEWTMHDIAKRLEDSLRDAGADNALISWGFKGSNETGRFTITGQWRGVGTKVFPPSAPRAGVTDISDGAADPFYTSSVTVTEGTVTLSDSQPDTIDPASRWTKVAAPGSTDAQPDKTTMPVTLTLDTFTGDGATAATWTVDQIIWNARLNGDAETNPPVTFLDEGMFIQDVTFHADRMLIAAGENVAFSQTGDFFNFWLEDPLNLVDSDPIDIPVSTGASVQTVEFLSNYRTTIVAFTKADRQAVLNTPDVLSPDTARFTPGTMDRKTSNVRPVVMGDLMYYTGPRADESILFEHNINDVSLLNVSESVSKHVVGLLPTTIQSLTADTNNSKVFITPTDCDHIFVYEPDWLDREKVQSAWSEWQFHDSYRIVDTVSVKGFLFMLVESGSQFFIERIAVARQTLT